jgi:hypothetical protein
VAILGQLNPLNLLQTCKNQQAMLAGKSIHDQQCEKKKFVFRAEFFLLQNSR